MSFPQRTRDKRSNGDDLSDFFRLNVTVLEFFLLDYYTRARVFTSRAVHEVRRKYTCNLAGCSRRSACDVTAAAAAATVHGARFRRDK